MHRQRQNFYKALGFIIALVPCGGFVFAQRGQAPPTTRSSINITDEGARGDGQTVNTAAIQKALNSCAANPLGGEVVVPAGNFVTGSILLGPRTTLRLEKDAILTGSPNKDDYPVVNVRWEGEWRPGYRSLIAANNVDHIAIVGEGKIVGPPPALSRLRPNARSGEVRGPSMIEPIECKDLHLEGISLQYQGMWNIHLTYCQDVVAKNVTIRSTGGNGDGIDVDSSKNVLIDRCDIETGDDAICLKSGRGMEAVRIARPTEDVVIQNCKLSCPRFACIGMGTEMSGGIRNITVRDCTFGSAVNGFFIKSLTGRGGFIENITAENLEFSPEIQHLIEFDLVNKGISATENVQGMDGFPRTGNFHFNNIKTQAEQLFLVTAIAPEKPLDGLSFTNVSGTCKTALKLSNMKNVVLKNINVTGYDGEFLTATNVTGPNIENIKQPKDTMGQ